VVLLSYTGAESQRFREIAEALLACRNVLRTLLTESKGRITRPSASAADLDAFASRDPPVPEPWPMAVLKTTTMYLYGASEHLGALAALYTSEEVLLSPLVLARCAVEHAAYARWIIGDPNESADDRLARALLDEIHSAMTAEVNAGRRFGKDSSEHRARTDMFEAVKRDAESIFAPPYDRNGRRVLHGHVRPGPTGIVLDANRMNSRALPDDEMPGTYGFLSTTCTRPSTRCLNCGRRRKRTASSCPRVTGRRTSTIASGSS
jgi:hypothetical protein